MSRSNMEIGAQMHNKARCVRKAAAVLLAARNTGLIMLLLVYAVISLLLLRVKQESIKEIIIAPSQG